MRFRLIPAACGLLFLAMNIPAYGVTCYQIWDSRETLAYQSVMPPFDLSSPAFDRAMANLRARRGQLIFFDAVDCAIAGTGLTGPQSAGARDPASILVDVRTGVDPRAGGGYLAPVPASVGATSPMGAPMGMNAPPSTGTGANTPTRSSSGRY